MICNDSATIKKVKPIASLVIVVIALLGFSALTYGQSIFSQEELDYIVENPVLKAVSVAGSAPSQYEGPNGEPKGIAVEVLKEISKITGLIFDIVLYGSVEEAYQSNAHLGTGVSREYALNPLDLSLPYMKSETMLYMNSRLRIQDLENKKYALVKGGNIPEGISPENVVYFPSREACLNGVNAGLADYGLSNAHAVAFYTLQNGYKNLISVPVDMPEREYSLGVFGPNPVLLSILNKSLVEIGEKRMRTLILNASTDIERTISLQTILQHYSLPLLFIALSLVGSLSLAIVTYIRSNRELAMQNQRYELLSALSNEFFVEYFVDSGKLDFSSKFTDILGPYEDQHEVVIQLKEIFKNLHLSLDETASTIQLTLPSGELLDFKLIHSDIQNPVGETLSIIAKLVDISAELEEKAELQAKAELDGMTGLYNAQTYRELVKERINNKVHGEIDALLLLDCDDFKAINDTFGHLEGDKVLVSVAEALKASFRSSDIIGRVGGDEFCVYIKDLPSLKVAQSMADNFLNRLRNSQTMCTVSGGLALVDRTLTYEELFQVADFCMYRAKNQGGDRIVTCT